MLKGHIALDSAIFPESTPGFVLDALARQHLWAAGLDYRHGTGHGVGAALNVHEGPQGIAPRFGNTTGLQAGMIVSNEPGACTRILWCQPFDRSALQASTSTARGASASKIC